jgi:hypothetical protein
MSLVNSAGWVRRRIRTTGELGQVIVVVVLSMTALLVMAGFAIDVGSWYHVQRHQQAVADAAALAGAGDLPTSTAQASADANTYATKNGGAVNSLTFSSGPLANDTITVHAQAPASAFFLKLIGISSVNVKVKAIARAEVLSSAQGAAPFGVINTQPQLAGPGCPCFNAPTTLTLNWLGPGGFDVINIDGSQGGTQQNTLASWIQHGCGCTITTPTLLYSDTGAKFNSSLISNAMDAIIGQTVLFPVYDSIQGNGSNLAYHIIGFAGFAITSYDFHGSGGTITGSFQSVNWTGTGSTSGNNYFGATTTQLIG